MYQAQGVVDAVAEADAMGDIETPTEAEGLGNTGIDVAGAMLGSVGITVGDGVFARQPLINMVNNAARITREMKTFFIFLTFPIFVSIALPVK